MHTHARTHTHHTRARTRTEDGKFCIVTDYADGGDLHAAIKQRKASGSPKWLPKGSEMDPKWLPNVSQMTQLPPISMIPSLWFFFPCFLHDSSSLISLP